MTPSETDRCIVGGPRWVGLPPCTRQAVDTVRLTNADETELLAEYKVCREHHDEIVETFRRARSIYEAEPLPDAVLDVGAREGIAPAALGSHTEAVHGWEPHDEGYATAVQAAAECLRNGGCE